MIIGTNLSKSFSGTVIFENIDLKLGNNKKVALVGKNGSGKSTLMEILAGGIKPDKGIIKVEEETTGYLQQEFTFPDELVGEYLEKQLEFPWDLYKIDLLRKEVEFKNFDLYQEISTLSEGQKMKLKIIEILLKDPGILLIDEPTNHLDIEGILWFEKYIKNLRKTVLMISHDREFLNNTVDEIWEIENRSMYKFIGNYDNYKEEKLKLINKWDNEYVLFLKKKAQLEKLLENVRKIGDGKKRGRAVESVKKRIKREVEDNQKEKYVNKKVKPIDFETGITHSKLMVKFTEVIKSYEQNPVLNGLSFEIRGGEKVWLWGPNGAGKSTIVKIIVGEEKIGSGTVKIGNDIKIGYFAQKQTHLNYSDNLLDCFIKETGCYYGDAFGNLKKFLFEKDDLKKKIGDLSPGQRARFAFSVFAYKDYDMLILDEPDNHLDIDTKEIMEESLKDYKGTLLLISHDRFFVERSGINRLLNLKDGNIKDYY